MYISLAIKLKIKLVSRFEQHAPPVVQSAASNATAYVYRVSVFIAIFFLRNDRVLRQL